jgi:hypothetical protein
LGSGCGFNLALTLRLKFKDGAGAHHTTWEDASSVSPSSGKPDWMVTCALGSLVPSWTNSVRAKSEPKPGSWMVSCALSMYPTSWSSGMYVMAFASAMGSHTPVDSSCDGSEGCREEHRHHNADRTTSEPAELLECYSDIV